MIGSIRAGKIKECNLVLLAKKPSNSAGVLDAENKLLTEQVHRLFHSILLVRIPYFHNHGCTFTGAYDRDYPNIRQIWSLPQHYGLSNYGDSIQHLALKQSHLKEAFLSYKGLSDIYSNQNESRFQRLKRGFKMVLKGITEHEIEDRFHQFVRALDTLVKTGREGIRKTFIHRCRTTFSVDRNGVEDILKECYGLRSVIEHGHGWTHAFPELAEEQARQKAIERTKQIEKLVLGTYLKIMTSEEHRAHFQDDNTIEQFWKQDDHVRREQWGERIDITVI